MASFDPNQADFDEIPSSNSLAEPVMDAATERKSLRAIRRHTTPVGRIVTVAVLAGGVFLAWLWWQGEQANQHRMDGVEAAGRLPKSETAAALRAEWPKAKHSDVKERILKNLGSLRDEQSVPILIQALDEAGVVRRAAAFALAEIGLPGAETAKEKLLTVLKKSDARDSSQVVWTLAVLREERAADAIIDAFAKGLLQSKKGFDEKILAQVLGPARLGSDALIKHPQEAVRVLTAHALAESASAAAVEPLSRLLASELARTDKDRSNEVLRAAVAGLGRTADPRAARPLFALLKQDTSMKPLVLDAFRTSAGAAGLATLIQESKDDAAKRDLVRLLVETHDPRASDTFASLLASPDSEIRTTSAIALGELGDARANPVLFELSKSDDDATVNAAIAALRKTATASMVQPLVALLKELPNKKAGILRALGKTGEPSAAKAIEGSLKGDDMRAAAFALSDLRDAQGYKRLMQMVPRPANVDMSERKAATETMYQNRLAAVEAVGRYQRPESVPALMKVVEDVKDDPTIRSAAAVAIGTSATDEQINEVLAKSQDASLSENTRRYYPLALWQKQRPELVATFLEQVAQSNAPPELRLNSALAVGYAADSKADAKLSSMLDGESTRREAAFAIILGGSEEGAQKLLGILGQDVSLREVYQDDLARKDISRFDLVTESMFENGGIWRRLRVAQILREGEGGNSYSQAWTKITTALRAGSDGPGGASADFVRQALWNALKGNNETNRKLAAHVLVSIAERGLLLRARDEGGPGSDEARAAMRANGGGDV